MKNFIKNVQEMLLTSNTNIEFNNVVREINNDRILGSGNQCYHVMYMIAQYFNIQKLLEIGTHQGASSITFCQAIIDNNKIPEINTIDDWSQSGLLPAESAKFERIAINNIERSGFKKYITMHDGDSLIKVPEVFKNIGKVDLVFIDGNHAIDYVIADYNNCKNYSDKIIFHDTLQTDTSFFDIVLADGYKIYTFETRFLEGDGHLVGISLAIK
jgi:predicted O-methyltransferase YrrM